MKHVLILFLCIFTLCLSAYDNPMNTVRTSTIDGIAAVLTKAASEITLQSAPNQRMDLVVANGLAYLRKTAQPTWDGYFQVIQTKAAEYQVTDRIAFTGNIFEVLRPWWIGTKANKALLEPAIDYIVAHPHENLTVKAVALAYDLKEYERVLSLIKGTDVISGHVVHSYFALGQVDDGIQYYYDVLDKERWNASNARELFPVVWKAVLKKYGNDAVKMAEFKQLNAKYASIYTNKMYDSAKPESSPWRPLVTILTAQSK